MKSNDFIRKFKKLFWAPTTTLGNPLFKRTEENTEKGFITAVEQDIEYQTKIKSIWTSPSNIRAIFVGINKSFIVYHKGLSEGNNRVNELTINKKDEGFIIKNSNGEEKPENNSYKIYTFDNVIQNPQTKILSPKDINNFEEIKLDKNPIESIGTLFALPNIECLMVSLTAFAPQNINHAKEILTKLYSNNKRLETIIFVPEKSDQILGKGGYEQQIREYAENKYKSIYDFIPELKQFEVYHKDINFKTTIDVQVKQWAYDSFLSKWNETLYHDIDKNKQNNKENQANKTHNLTFLNGHFKELYNKYKGQEVMKKDYIIQVKLAKPGEKYYNKLEDAHYEGKSGDAVLIGTQNEEWTTSVEKVCNKYTLPDGTPLEASMIKEIPIKIKTIVGKEKVFAFHIKQDKNTTDRYGVKTSWAELTINSSKSEHGDGDWVVSYAKDGQINENNLAVINGLVFKDIYQKWKENKEDQDKQEKEFQNYKQIFEKNGWKIPENMTMEQLNNVIKELKNGN